MASGEKRKYDGNNRWTEDEYYRRSYRDKGRDERDERHRDKARFRDARDREGRGRGDRFQREERHTSRPPTPPQRRYGEAPSGARPLGTSNDLFSQAAKLIQERQKQGSKRDRPEQEAGSGSDGLENATEREPGELPKRKKRHSPIVWHTPPKAPLPEPVTSKRQVDERSVPSPSAEKLSPREEQLNREISFQRAPAEPGSTPKLTPDKPPENTDESLQRLMSEEADEEEEFAVKAKSGVSSRWLELENGGSSQEAEGNIKKDDDGPVSSGACAGEDEGLGPEAGPDVQTANGSHEAAESDEPDSPITQRAILMTQECRSVEEFERLNRISEGAYGVVYRAREKKTGRICALKKVKMDKERDGFPMTSIREINILLSLQHPNIVNVSEVVVGNSLDSVFMVMEYMEHDLKALAEQTSQPFAVSEVKCLMQQLLRGVAYLHENWVIHRDLKTSNLLYNSKGQLKICDFGLARQFGSPLRPYTHLVVTLWYRAPELLLGAKQYDTAIDIWSVGCIMAEWLTKEVLFDGKSEMDQIDKIFKLLGVPSEDTWPGFRNLPNVKKLNFKENDINNLRSKFPQPTFDFDGRPNLSDAGFDLLNKLLTLCPKKRLSAEEALNHPWFTEHPLPKDVSLMPTFPSRRNNGVNVTRPKLHHPSPDPRVIP